MIAFFNHTLALGTYLQVPTPSRYHELTVYYIPPYTYTPYILQKDHYSETACSRLYFTCTALPVFQRAGGESRGLPGEARTDQHGSHGDAASTHDHLTVTRPVAAQKHRVDLTDRTNICNKTRRLRSTNYGNCE